MKIFNTVFDVYRIVIYITYCIIFGLIAYLLRKEIGEMMYSFGYIVGFIGCLIIITDRK